MATIVPPLGFGLAFLVPALAVCLVCLTGLLILGLVATGRRRKLMAPTMFCLVILLVLILALTARSVIT